MPTTTNEKLAVMEWEVYEEPALPLGPSTPFSTADQQQLLWGYPGVAWAPPVVPPALLAVAARYRWRYRLGLVFTGDGQ
jgi:hypothetical protein